MQAGTIARMAMSVLVVAGCMPAAPASPSTERPTGFPSATSTVTATGQPTPIVVAGASRVPLAGEIEPGRYFVPHGPLSPVTFSFTLPAGWSGNNLGQGTAKHLNESGRELGWGVSIVDRLFADPCGENDTIDVGPVADDLIDALLALPGPEARGPFDVTIGGRTGQHLELTAPADLAEDDCDPPIGLQIWRDNGGNYFVLGQAPVRLYAIDVDGSRFVIVATSSLRQNASSSDIAELDAILESIRFEL